MYNSLELKKQIFENTDLFVLDMDGTFYNCYSLETAPTIPSSVKYMNSTFYNCSALTGYITINTQNLVYYDAEMADLYYNYDSCFYGTSESIILRGSAPCSILEGFAETASNGNVTVQY